MANFFPIQSGHGVNLDTITNWYTPVDDMLLVWFVGGDKPSKFEGEPAKKLLAKLEEPANDDPFGFKAFFESLRGHISGGMSTTTAASRPCMGCGVDVPWSTDKCPACGQMQIPF